MFFTTRRRQASAVLVVDDHVDGAEALQVFLELQGFAVSAVHSISKANDWLATNVADAVIADLALEDGGGFGIPRIARGSRSADAYLVALSGLGGTDSFGKEYVARARAAGFDAYLMKPPVLEEIVAILRGDHETALRYARDVDR